MVPSSSKNVRFCNSGEKCSCLIVTKEKMERTRRKERRGERKEGDPRRKYVNARHSGVSIIRQQDSKPRLKTLDHTSEILAQSVTDNPFEDPKVARELVMPEWPIC